jgi:hypothetical protein
MNMRSIETKLNIMILVLALVWIVITNIILQSATLPWLPILLIFFYALYSLIKSEHKLSSGIGKKILIYEIVFVFLTAVYFIIQRLDEIFFPTVLPQDIIIKIGERYSLLNSILQVSWFIVLVISIGVILYVATTTKRFSAAFGFKSAKDKGVGKSILYLIIISIIIGALYDYLIIIFLSDLTTPVAIMIEEIPLFILGIYAIFNILMYSGKFTGLTRKTLIAGGIYIILLIMHFILRYIDINTLIAPEELFVLITSYSQERIILSVVMYGILISILVTAVLMSREVRKLNKEYISK